MTGAAHKSEHHECIEAVSNLSKKLYQVTKDRDALLAACEAASCEIVTLLGRLSEPYRSNMSAVLEMCRAALAQARGQEAPHA